MNHRKVGGVATVSCDRDALGLHQDVHTGPLAVHPPHGHAPKNIDGKVLLVRGRNVACIDRDAVIRDEVEVTAGRTMNLIAEGLLALAIHWHCKERVHDDLVRAEEAFREREEGRGEEGRDVGGEGGKEGGRGGEGGMEQERAEM